MTSKYQDILDSLTNEKEDLSVNSKVFIVDGLNTVSYTHLTLPTIYSV